MEFRTKREAEEAVMRLERRAERAMAAAINNPAAFGAEVYSARAAQHRAEAVRIRALLPTLPEWPDDLPSERLACANPACGHAQHMHFGTGGECCAIISDNPHAERVLCPCDRFRQ